jgi:uncharacterized protein YdeI (YjbR/CyaY-like superfamily)
MAYPQWQQRTNEGFGIINVYINFLVSWNIKRFQSPMFKKAATIDEYINQAAPFAVPVLMHLRELVHRACPEVTETIKWSFPVFEYHGSILCTMGAFKAHCSFGFWKDRKMPDPEGILQTETDSGAGSIGRIVSLKDLPKDKILIAYIKMAATKSRDRIKALPVKSVKKKVAKEMECPEILTAALKKNKNAAAGFQSFSPSKKNEYIEWISEAKTEATRDKRLATALEWMAEGKSRNWKYQ